jgi:paired small multidrug resistance pump
MGFIGAVLVLIAYLQLLANKISSESFRYSILNLIGSILILFSLAYAWNLAATIVEVLWVIISIFGVIKYLKGRKAASYSS